MTKKLILKAENKEGKYKELIPQIESLIEGEQDLIANMANVSAAIKYCFNFLWVGFYIVKENQLVLGPFQGPVACTRIQKGRGVCGAVWEKEKTIIVPNVNEFPGHIACNEQSKSEIVLPLFANKKMVAVLDIDHDELNSFDETDLIYLEKIVRLFKF